MKRFLCWSKGLNVAVDLACFETGHSCLSLTGLYFKEGECKVMDGKRKTGVIRFSTLFLTFLLGLFILVTEAYAWSNGGYSSNSLEPDYGTHDWIAEHALDWLPANEKAYNKQFEDIPLRD
ncbi:MAG: hypothetical protein N0A00_05010 [Candidatus Bathyarchaeota archaeon]|nr:hypothetical protein [Candidatus Bathyarchaeota archaeon]